MSQYIFLITSAINTKFGIYNSDQRIQQTLNTVQSIRQRVPAARIILLEMSAISLTEQQKQQLLDAVDNILDFTTDPVVQQLYHSTENWDIVKNVTEVMCFNKALKQLTQTNQLVDSQRIFKISGRYLLSDDFDIGYYDQYSVQSHIVVSKSRDSQFDFATTQIERQFMSRLWSWPTVLTAEIIESYDRGLVFMQERLFAGGYADIEHVLYKFLDHKKVIELDTVGIYGNIGPNGTLVKD